MLQWGKKSLKIHRGAGLAAGYVSDTKLRKWKWSNHAEPLPKWIPRPDFNKPVRYTVQFDVFVDKAHSTWRNIFNRGSNNADRTPGVWVYPGSTRIHWRHSTNKEWNADAGDSSWTPPYGKWFRFKAVVDHDRSWSYINGMLDRVVDLRGTGTHYTVRTRKELGWKRLRLVR